jgi:hypothetical protein
MPKKQKVIAKKRKKIRQLELFLLKKKLYIICGEYVITNVHIINNASADDY